MVTVCKPETTFGLQAESWVIEFLVASGRQVIQSTEVEDRIHKVDFWIYWGKGWLAIQFSIDRHAMVNGKGTDALRRGICPAWLDGQELKIAKKVRELQPHLVEQFVGQVKRLVAAYPELLVRRPVVTALNGK